MPAGGTWQSQNKVRPGAYINVVGVPKPTSKIGERGTVAIPMQLDWGEKLVSLTAQEFLTGDGFKKIGLSYTDYDSKAQMLRLAFQGASKAIIRRTNVNPGKASVTAGSAYIVAKYGGIFGNSISVDIILGAGVETEPTEPVIVDDTSLLNTRNLPVLLSNEIVSITMNTYVGGVLKESTTRYVEDGDVYGLSNDWVDVTTSTVSSFEPGTYTLTGGTNGVISESPSFDDIFADLEQENWNVLAWPEMEVSAKDAAVAFIKSMRDGSGIKVQAVLTECTSVLFSQGEWTYEFTPYNPNYEGIYVCKQGYRLSDGTEIDPTATVAMVAGMVAGATMMQSLTGTVIPNAVEVLNPPKTNQEIIDALNNGKFVLSKRRDGAVVVEYDINSFTALSAKKGKVFTKGRPMRVLDNICNDVKALFDNVHLGKTDNDDNGRNIFKGDLIKYFRDLEKLGAITNFDSENDIEVLRGDDIDAVVVNLWVQPVDSMEKLYLTLNVWG